MNKKTKEITEDVEVIPQPKIFDLTEIGFKDLEGNFINLDFDKVQFANIMFPHVESIDTDNFLRSLHKEGKAEINDVVIAEVLNFIPKVYKFRAVQAIKEYIEKL